MNLGHLPQIKETVETSTLTHWFDWAKAKVLNTKLRIQWGILQVCRPLQCQAISLLGFRGISTIYEKLGARLGRVFSAIWGQWVSGLCHCDQSPLVTQLGVETQPLRVIFWPKVDHSNAMINIRWVRLFPQNSQKVAIEQPKNG